MRIKHFQGYGNVSAIRTHCADNKIIIRVSGLHECGLVLPFGDKYWLTKWLGKVGKFTEEQVMSFTTQEHWDTENRIDVCEYTIRLKPKET
jgi:hypothetical protein